MRPPRFWQSGTKPAHLGSTVQAATHDLKKKQFENQNHYTTQANSNQFNGNFLIAFHSIQEKQ